jgi:hypothetical protein
MEDPEFQHMLCTDIQIDESILKKAFIESWNQLVER